MERKTFIAEKKTFQKPVFTMVHTLIFDNICKQYVIILESIECIHCAGFMLFKILFVYNPFKKSQYSSFRKLKPKDLQSIKSIKKH